MKYYIFCLLAKSFSSVFLFSWSWTTNLIRSSSDKQLSWLGLAIAVKVVESFCSNMLTRVSSAANWFNLCSKSHFGSRANYLESNLTASVTLRLSSSFCSVVSYLSIRVDIYSGGSQLRQWGDQIYPISRDYDPLFVAGLHSWLVACHAEPSQIANEN